MRLSLCTEVISVRSAHICLLNTDDGCVQLLGFDFLCSFSCVAAKEENIFWIEKFSHCLSAGFQVLIDNSENRLSASGSRTWFNVPSFLCVLVWTVRQERPDKPDSFNKYRAEALLSPECSELLNSILLLPCKCLQLFKYQHWHSSLLL